MRSLSISLLGLSLTVCLTACGVETIIHGLTEPEANRIIVLMADNHLEAHKLVKEGRTQTYDITVPAGSRVEAIRLLNRHELPRRQDKGYTDVFAEGGLIPTSAEEKAKQLAALEGEIERQLKLVDGVLDAEVQLVMPEESALRTSEEHKPPTTASVTLRYLPGAAGEKPLSEPQIQALVAAGVEDLTADRVYPLLTPAVHASAESITDPTGERAGAAGSWLARFSKKQVNVITTVMIVLVLILCLLLFFGWVRLRRVRNMLLRLQNQIADARRRQGGGESLPPPAQG